MCKYTSIGGCIALIILLSFSGCGNSVAPSNTAETVSESTNAGTKKYSSLTPYSLGSTSEFAQCFENKLHLILNIDDFKLEEKETKFDAKTQTGTRGCAQTISHYTFSGFGGEEAGGLYFELMIFDDDRNNENPGTIKSMTIKPHFPGRANDLTKPVLANADEAIFENNICAWLMPIAVFEDYNSKEELLDQYKKYEVKKNTPKGYIGEKIMTDIYISYSQYNEKDGWINFCSYSDDEQRNKYDRT